MVGERGGRGEGLDRDTPEFVEVRVTFQKINRVQYRAGAREPKPEVSVIFARFYGNLRIIQLQVGDHFAEIC